MSLAGVLVIPLHGDLPTLKNIEFNKGDVIFTAALAIFGLLGADAEAPPDPRPLCRLHLWRRCIVSDSGLHLGVVLTFAAAARCRRPRVAGLCRGVPSTLAYLCFNPGVQLIGANRAAPFFHLIPVFGSAMAIFFLGEQPHWFHLFGYALVLTGVYVASRQPG